MNNNRRDIIAATDNGKKGDSASYSRPEGSRGQAPQALVAPNRAEIELVKLRAAITEIQRLRLSAQHELELTKRIRAETEKYRQEIETKAQSQAYMLIIQARLATKKELAELKRGISQEIQELLADTRLIRNTAQENLETQQRFTDAARICALSLSSKEDAGERSESEEEAIVV